ncbi:MAG: phosphopantetheine-binding protein [Lachnospiraceae bacterium]|nr:phosphopantetheine-binding protein [Lachnospiraceae bacterium]
MNEKELEIAENIKGMLSKNLRIPAEELDYEVPLFGDGIGLDSVDSLEIISCIDASYNVDMTGVDKEHFYNITSLTKYVVANM